MSDKKTKREKFSNNYDPELYFEVKILSERLKKKGIKKNANQLIEEGMNMVLKKYYTKYPDIKSHK